MLAGLARQTYKDFEVVFVDGLYHERHEKVLDAVRLSGLERPFFHVPNHRYQPGIWGTTCAGYNTGFALAAGDFVVMLLDYGYAPPMWLEEHAKHQDRGEKIILGPHEYRTLAPHVPIANLRVFDRAYVDSHPLEDAIAAIGRQRSLFDLISCFAESFDPDDLDEFVVEEGDVKCRMPTQEWFDSNYFATKNESFPTKAVLDVNGMDEHYDKGRGPGDPDLCHRLRRTGLPLWIVNETIVRCLNPRGILPNMNVVIPENAPLPPPYEKRWFMADGYRYFDKVKLRESPRAANPFDIRALREEIWSWRVASQFSAPLIPRRVVADEDYFRGGEAS